MLFQRVYNWIKYKSLPTSFLFKNRLFIERASKHKKIFTNFGAHYKNSKWAHFSTSAIRFYFKNKYKNFILNFFLYLSFFVLILLYNKYYAQLPILNNLIFFVWSAIDAAQYCVSFFFWTLFILFVKIFNFTRNLFDFNNFSNKNYFKKTDGSAFSSSTASTKTYTKKFIFKEDLNFFINIWLNNNFSKNSVKNNYKFFNSDRTTLRNNLWIINSYKFCAQFDGLNNVSNVFKLQQKFNKINKNSFPIFFIYKNFDVSECLSKCLILNNDQNTYFEKTIKNARSTISLNSRTNWNLISIFPNIAAAKKNNLNLFWFKNFNQKSYLSFLINNPEFQTMTTDLNNQLLSSKTQRWLYRYYPIHRKSLKFANKILQSSKIQFSTFADQFNINNHLWTQNWPIALKLTSKTSDVNSRISVDLKKTINQNFLSVAQIQKHANQHYSSSYLWALKKFYFFNFLSSNYFVSTFKSNLNKLNDETTLFATDLTIISSALNRFSALNFNKFCLNQIIKMNNFNNYELNANNKKDLQIFFKNLTILDFDLINGITKQEINLHINNFNLINWLMTNFSQNSKLLKFNESNQLKCPIILYISNSHSLNNFFFDDLKEFLTNY